MNKDKISEFIRRGNEIKEKEHHVPGRGLIMPDYIAGPLYDQWMSEIEIFSQRYLKDHPLQSSIHTAHFHRNNKLSAYDDMMGYLMALEADDGLFPNVQSDIIENKPIEPDEFYNLFVTGRDNAFSGNRFIMPIDRALKEYITNDVKAMFSSLNESTISQIKAFPSLFVHENNLGEHPDQEAYYGFVTDVKIRENGANVYFQKLSAIPQKVLNTLAVNLAINKMEFTRTHWTIKRINLLEELTDAGLVISEAVQTAFDINTHEFDIAVTFAGENRPFVKEVVDNLSLEIASNRIFYDNFYEAFLARPSLDTLLQNIYHKRSKLIIVFLCEAYQDKEWCGLEFHAIRDIIKRKELDRIMYVRMDDGEVDGVFSTDGYIDARTHSAAEIAKAAIQRLSSILPSEVTE